MLTRNIRWNLPNQGAILLITRITLVGAIMVETPPEFNYQNLEPYGITGEGRTELMFTVEACKDARVALYPYDPVIDGDTMYEVVFGGSHNTRHTIRTRRADNNYLVNMTTIANLLSCTEYRSFWISWKNFYIIGGTGLTVGIDKVVEYNDTRPSPYIVRYIGISTWRNHAGKWIFSNEVPRFLSVSPSSVYATKGDPVVLYCKSIGIPLPVITWQKDGVNISDNQNKYNTSIIGYLTIHNFQNTDSGLFRCTATNSEGDNSHDVRVDCREFPTFSSLSSSAVYATKGESVVLHCASIGIPIPVVTWRKDGLNVSDDQNKYNTSSSGYLTIQDFENGDSGVYRCTATNSEGEISHDVQVHYCDCCSLSNTNQTILTEGDINLKLQTLKETLYINPKKTALSKRRKISADDPRRSSLIVGMTCGVSVICSMVALLVCPDVLSLLRYFLAL